jgi:GTP-binding protein
MAITIAIVGRPNVGKSTLFNHLTRSRSALVSDQPGMTRDRHYGFAEFADRQFIVIDTGGLLDDGAAQPQLAADVERQAYVAMAEADAVYWLVDGRAGLTAQDEVLAGSLRKLHKRIYLLVNKCEGLDMHIVTAEFHALGMGAPMPISARRGSGVAGVMETAARDIPSAPEQSLAAQRGLRVCIIGRPNVGKSTLTNRLLGEDRMLIDARPGTTRDSIRIPFQRRGRDYVLIDTAGVRRRARVNDRVEKLTVLKTLEALDQAQVVILVIDASEGLTEQDLTLLGLCAESGKSLLLAVNKWDGLRADQKRLVKNQLDRKLGFADYAVVHFISALHGTGVGKLFDFIDRIGRAQTFEEKPSRLTEILEAALAEHQPPLVRGRSIKLRYAHLGGRNPLRIVVHGNQVEHVPASYRRYLSHVFRVRLKLVGTPVLVDFRGGENPYAGKMRPPTKRQATRRRRLLRHVKK